MKSVYQKIMQLEGLSGTKDVNNWEREFIDSVVTKVHMHPNTAALSDKQVEIVDRIWSRHFA